MRIIRVGVAGVGHMGKNHVRILADEKRFDLVGVYDIDSTASAVISKEYDVISFDSYEKMLDNVEAVVIAVPSYLHHEYGRIAAQHGVHALIEKPLDIDYEAALQLTNYFEQKDLVLFVGHVERFNPVIEELEKIVPSNEVFYIEANRYSPFFNSGRIKDTGVVEDLMIHDIDIIMSIMNKDLKSIHGFGESIKTDKIDYATCVLEFEDAHAIINASRVSQTKERTVTIHTNSSVINADLLHRSLLVVRNSQIILSGQRGDHYQQEENIQKIFVPNKEALQSELISFHDAISGGKTLIINGHDAAKMIKICEIIKGKACSYD